MLPDVERETPKYFPPTTRRRAQPVTDRAERESGEAPRVSLSRRDLASPRFFFTAGLFLFAFLSRVRTCFFTSMSPLSRSIYTAPRRPSQLLLASYYIFIRYSLAHLLEDKTARQVPRRMTTKTCGSNTIFFFSACVLYFKRCGRACFPRLFLSVCCAAFCVLHKYKCSHQHIHSRSLALSLSRLTKTSFVLAHVVLASRSRPALRVTFYFILFFLGARQHQALRSSFTC